jgi:hypothetical protein
MILDSRGELVWLGPDTATHHKLNFDVQVLDDKPVSPGGRENSFTAAARARR